MEVWIVKNLWLIPALPLLAAGVSALLPQRFRKASASLAIVSMIGAFLLSLCAFAHAIHHNGHESAKEFFNFAWLQFAAGEAGVLKLGWVLDPLTAVMLVMVTFVGTLIFIYSIGYMAHDESFTRFFTFLSLFAAAMLGIVIANNLLMLFMSWELVGLASYLLIGFWYHKPSAAAAAKKAFITTRIGDVFFFLGIMWLYHETGTLLFYDNGAGCLETTALTKMIMQTTVAGLAVSTLIGILIFIGAMGKSGQFPLHVWLPDAMEGPTPVSALIHAATMVAAGVFLVARTYPIFESTWQGLMGDSALPPVSVALQVVTWIGAITAVFAASIAVAQNDIKRILAYSTCSQLGFMMMGLGTGGVAVGMFHLITHAFFKALLFIGAGSVIHGCHHEQDIRKMGGIRNYMPVTFLTYAVGMMALAGVPLFFSGFWSKDAILHAAHGWSVSHLPFCLGVAGALLTAFYMTRQMALVFWGNYRSHVSHDTQHIRTPELVALKSEHEPHESPRSMTVPLVILAVCAIGLGAIGTPAWPWFQEFLGSHHEEGFTREVVQIMMVSGLVVLVGGGLGIGLYGFVQRKRADEPDVLEKMPLGIHTWLARKYGIDELYEMTVIRFNAWAAKACAFLDEWIWGGAVKLVSLVTLAFAWVNRAIDEFVINLGFDQSCERVSKGGSLLSRLQDGHVQNYLRVIGVALVVLVLFLIWGGGK
ncbi:MAG: NADH-quinone oxidoreductase subunit L [Verrucomicrobiota bacterium]